MNDTRHHRSSQSITQTDKATTLFAVVMENKYILSYRKTIECTVFFFTFL